MITERRQIIFSGEALKEAVLLFRESYPDRLPHGQVRKVWPIGEPETQLLVQIEPLGARRFVEHTLSQREIAAGVILYCRRARIPLPRTADKYLEVEGGRLSLVLTMNVTPDLTAGA